MTTRNAVKKTKLHPSDIERIVEARHHDPFNVLGLHGEKSNATIRAFIPRAKNVRILPIDQAMQRIPDTDLFEWQGDASEMQHPYQFRWIDSDDKEHTRHDPYAFAPQISDFDLHLFCEGKHWHVYRFMGSNIWEVDGVKGVLFATWAPNAERVSVVGDFNRWDGRVFPMRSRGSSGVWELFIPGLAAGDLYKFEIRSRVTGNVESKTDPYAKQFEVRPKTAAIVNQDTHFFWQDDAWMSQRKNTDWLHQALSIYEVHLGSWQRGQHGQFLSYRELAHQLVDYVKRVGFTHIELLPITEHPLDASWGYQTLGYFAPTSRFGTPDDFRYFVNHCHQNGIGVFLDWVPAHFPTDSHGLGRFDGTALYEHEDPRKGQHLDWGTFIYNYGRNEVKNFLLASALYWLEEFHLDGLRVDAVASMLYLDYSRKAGEWVPNQYGGRENLEAMEFLRALNTATHSEHPGTLIMAEESTAWPQVSRPVYLGGLGFSMKWNMGWMHDTLVYFSKDPVHRPFHHNQLTFGLLYSFTENFILPFSHDEVVHGKASLRGKMPGDEWQQFANLRLLYGFMFSYPGKKLLFMGCEFGQGPEWRCDAALDWYVLQYPLHQGLQQLVARVNQLYRELPALHRYDFDAQGFEWIDCNDSAQSVVSYIRKSDDDFVVVVINATPVPRHHYRLGVPQLKYYQEALNSDAAVYGGSNMGNLGGVMAENIPYMGRPFSIELTLPPLAALILQPV